MMKYGVDEARKYLNKMDKAIGDKLIVSDSLYSEERGHIRLAHEIGATLNNFDEKGQREIVQGSYGRLYVKHCDLKPIFSMKEWKKYLDEGKKGEREREKRREKERE